MLQQMGWRRGEGLGRDAAGIVNPIAAEQYAQGAGLGAAHSKRSISATANGSDSYKDRAKEMVVIFSSYFSFNSFLLWVFLYYILRHDDDMKKKKAERRRDNLQRYYPFKEEETTHPLQLKLFFLFF